MRSKRGLPTRNRDAELAPERKLLAVDMTDMELRAFEAHLDIMVDQIGEESTELIIERPRYAHAVMVLSNGDEPGELLTASRIKVLDPIFIPIETANNGNQVFHQYCPERETAMSSQGGSAQCDDDIERALRKLEQSRNMLDEDEPELTAQSDGSTSPQTQFSEDLINRFDNTTRTVKATTYQFPSELRQERRGVHPQPRNKW